MPSDSIARLWRAKSDWRVELGPVWLALALALYCSYFLNDSFWSSLLKTQTGSAGARWPFFWAVYFAITAIHFALINLVFTRWTAKPLVLLLVLSAIGANHFSVRYGVHYDVSMMRNVLATHPGEASELLGASLWLDYLIYGLPVFLVLVLVEVKPEGWKRFAAMRLGWSLLALGLAVGALLLVFQNFAATMRNHKEIRHLILPSSYLVSSLRLATQSSVPKRIQSIGEDAHRVLDVSSQQALLVVLVVGETARASNWGLSGYSRQTTPELAALDVLNFPYATSCGTNTEVSVPCMFSPWGRRQYDEQQIRSSESLLHVLNRAGVKVQWIDNQAGCKGVCRGLPSVDARELHKDRHCDHGECGDGLLLEELKTQVSAQPSSQMVVLHQLGNHGPAYHARYGADMEHFKPACRSDDLSQCKIGEIVNAYDNALMATDRMLASTIRWLDGLKDRRVLFIYVSDHGESLGESGLFLHGMPYAIAPDVQTQVPMVVWQPERDRRSPSPDWQCMKQRAKAPAHHDNLFHTVLGLYRVQTTVYEPEMDLFRGCRG